MPVFSLQKTAETAIAGATMPSGKPTPAGILDPGLRGCERIDYWLDYRCASFETAALRLPQDEDTLTYLILRSVQSARSPRSLPSATSSCSGDGMILQRTGR